MLYDTQTVIKIRLPAVNRADQNHVTEKVAQDGADQGNRRHEPNQTPDFLYVRLWHNSDYATASRISCRDFCRLFVVNPSLSTSISSYVTIPVRILQAQGGSALTGRMVQKTRSEPAAALASTTVHHLGTRN